MCLGFPGWMVGWGVGLLILLIDKRIQENQGLYAFLDPSYERGEGVKIW